MTIVEPLAPSAESLDRERVVQADTDVGPVWLERDAELMTPAVLEHGFWAPEITALMRSILRPGMTFVDVGANIGYFSVLGSKLVGPTGSVISVEVASKNVEVLRANLFKNECSNAKVFQVAAWNEATTLNLVLNDAGGAGNSVNDERRGGVEVPAARLDQLIDVPVDYMKLDCEGSDHLAVSGAGGLIDRNPKMLITVEFMSSCAARAIEIYLGLRLKPYEIRVEGTLRPTRYDKMKRLGAEEPTAVPDYALTRVKPRELIGRVDLREEFRMHTSPETRQRVHHLLSRGGDLLDYIPERWRPRIRNRDRHGTG
jgi:FkbM family methyltransferase